MACYKRRAYIPRGPRIKRMASCHPNKPHRGLELCASCYWTFERRRRGVQPIEVPNPTEPKACAECGEVKESAEFIARRRNRVKDGKPYVYVNTSRVCKPCEYKQRVQFDIEHRNLQRARNKRRWENPAYRAWAKQYWDGKGKDVRERHWKTEKYKVTVARNGAKRRDRLAQSSHTLTSSEWLQLLNAYERSCAYCGIRNVRIVMDHVVPVSKLGPTSKENVVPACDHCNSKKSDAIWEPLRPIHALSWQSQ